MESAADTFGLGATHISANGGAVLGATLAATIDPARYRIVREVARGGMGRVSLAEDVVLGRTVAIKELLDAREDLVSRFRRELALTARLQHPGIVSIHDGGIWTTGELAYVMRYVTGASLEKVIGDAATLDQRLALLPNAVAVVDAIAYAHARDIIHRDLKPANILVGEFGETVVIDWGLAKDLRSSDVSEPRARGSQPEALDETQAGAVLGTPAYMAPEQAAGDPVDARADVYSLGAVLYHVLAGEGPHNGPSIEAVLVKILDGAITPLAERAPSLPRDLLAIVAKAMARDPVKRYAHAGELAADLKRFAAGQLVGAQRYTPYQLVGRWLRKHKTIVAVATVATAVSAAVGAASLSQVVSSRARAVEAEREATAARRDAEGLMDFMLVDLRKGLEPVGKVDLLFGVASRARDYYDRRVVADHDHVLARANLGDVLFDQRDDRGALGEHVAALALAATVGLARPHDPSWQTDAAAAQRSIGNLETALADLPAAERAYRASLVLAVGDQAALAAGEVGLARALRLQGKLDEALAQNRAGLELAAAHASLVPDADDRQHALFRAHVEQGHILSARESHDASAAEFAQALAIANHLGGMISDEDRAIAHSSRAFELKKLKDRSGARRELEAAAALEDGLVHHDPQNANWQRNLIITKNALAKLSLEDKDYPTALAIYRETLAIRVRDAAADPTNATKQHDAAMSHYYVADVLEDSGDKAGSLAEYREAYKITAALVKRDPTNARWQQQAKELADSIAEMTR